MTKEQKELMVAEMEKDYLVELEQFESVNVAGGGLSSLLGNDGKFCTLTVECMPSCN
ncbi:lichenicidin alpha family lanthipeptide [Bacillus massilinigeriensis]|uniref:lichenicidin alpha family lanthipeptide n=1 Tax=Bacillus mediterraneensis TaxID=1805474 RepID=UPI0009F409A0|nr:lichenicidin alpha family lanthipeptide [Bacillus mediterraneensis]